MLLLWFIVNFTLVKRLTDTVVIFRPNKKIMQSISLQGKLKKYSKIDYFKDKEKLKEIFKNDWLTAIDKLEPNKTYLIDTNRWIYENVLRPKEEKGIIKIEKEKEITKIQAIEKLALMNRKTIWGNLLNKKFWRTIFRKEGVGYYKIYKNV